ncbi:TM2 domain-containing protein [Corynebacterium uterequi]|uniref:TM2 domain-containing protein n=1 Tax=Corynebacterium uterequi TaxID=1072256 RepID=UPI0038B22F86
MPFIQPKSRLIALVLCFFLGSLGIHHFYVGNKSAGFGMLALSVVGWVTAIVLIGFAFLGDCRTVVVRGPCSHCPGHRLLRC